MSMILAGKKILLFSPAFFGYEHCIKNKMQDMGAEVILCDERNNPSTLEKVLIRLNLRSFISAGITKYYNDIIAQNHYDDFNYVIFLNPETVTASLIKKMRLKYATSYFVLYMWDSFCNKRHTKELLPFFDATYSFDKSECEKYGMKFRPLFFIDDYDANRCKAVTSLTSGDVCFIGTIHSDRYKILNAIRSFAIDNNVSYFYYMYFPSKLLYIKHAIFDTLIRSAGIKAFKYVPLSKDSVYDQLCSCKFVIDIQHPKQTGLTLRTIEMLGMKKKMITTNSDIKKYDFFRSENILIIDRKDIQIDSSFLESEYREIDSTIRNNYSLESFIADIVKIS